MWQCPVGHGLPQRLWLHQRSEDLRKLTHSAGSVVLAQLGPSLLDDECEVGSPMGLGTFKEVVPAGSALQDWATSEQANVKPNSWMSFEISVASERVTIFDVQRMFDDGWSRRSKAGKSIYQSIYLPTNYSPLSAIVS